MRDVTKGIIFICKMQVYGFALQVLLVGSFLQVVKSFNNCPRACECFSNRDTDMTITVDCSGRDLIEIPYPLPNRTSHLDASRNLIQYIRSVDFSPGDTFLRFLQLQNNDLIDIESGAFRRLPNLQTLNLENNNRLGISSDLREGVFDGLDNLLTLSAFNLGLNKLPTDLFRSFRDIIKIDLRFNQLEEIAKEDFVGLKRLQRILLSDNYISNIQASAFSNLPFLRQLDLSNNQLRAITPMAFSKLPLIRLINLTGNPIECGCCAMYLQDFFSRMRLASPICQSPQQFQGVPLLDLNTSSICVLPTAMISPGEDVVVGNGVLFELNCTTSGLPPPQVSWSRNGMSLEADDSRIIINDGTLIITETNVTDSGEYHCSASSAAGLVSSSVEVAVLESTEPTVTEAVVRDNVVLDCSSEIPPGVSVHWIFNSSTLAPASDKYAVLRNGSLLIIDLWLEDMGDYICQLGRVFLVRRLSLTARPEILSITQGSCEDPERIVVDSNMDITVRCEVFGIPTPTVMLLTPIPTMVDITMMGGSVVATLLLRGNGLLPREGDYTCVGSNSLGTVNQTITIVIRTVATLREPVQSRIDAFEGDTIVMECGLVGVDFEGGEDVAWRRFDGIPLPLDRISFTCSNNQTLILRDVRSGGQMPDTANYLCRFRGFTGLVFVMIFQFPTIMKDCVPPTIVARVGDNITLSCPAQGNPAINWMWTKGGVMVESGRRILLTGDGEFLNLFSLQEEDSGLYNCTVSNIVSGSLFSDTYAIIVDVQRPPHFTYRPQSITSLSGDRAVLFCGGKGNPVPTVTWFRLFTNIGPGYEGIMEEVVSGGRISIGDNFLLFTEVQLSDEGFYFCNLTSPLGSRISNKALLNVYMFPSVNVPLSEVNFEIGTVNAVIECNELGDPIPDIRWLRLPNMNLVPSPGFPNYVRNGSNLVILNVRGEDAGVYRCWVANTAGQVFQDVEVTVIAPPETSVEPSSLVANIGCQVMFVCLDGGNPPLDFQWRFNGNPLEMGPELMILDNGEFILSNVQIEDSGNYSCTVRGLLHETNSTAVLTVQDPLFPDQLNIPYPPFIASPTPSVQLFSLGQTAQFVCLVEGFPVPQLVWLKDGELLRLEEGRVEIVMSKVLVISNITSSDDATYECFAFSSMGNTSREFTLSVLAPPEIIEKPKPQTVNVHSTINLTCLVTGNPLPIIFWLLNDSMLVPDDRHSIEREGNTLLVFNATIENSGFYTCLAWNDVGSDQHTVTVTVIDFDAIEVLSVRARPNSTTVEAGSSIILDCLIDGFPAPTITWFKDGIALPACSQELPPQEVCVDNIFSVYVTSGRVSDSGAYTCRAQSSRGYFEYTAVVTVLPKRSIPFFLVSPESQSVPEGSMVTLDCVARGNPLPNITWLLNMQPINLTSATFQQLENSSLVITSVQSDTIGFFTCLASNRFGSSEITVLVENVAISTASNNSVGLSRPVVTSYPLGTLTMFPEQSKVLDCSAVGNPPPVISWTRNGVLLDNTSFHGTLSIARNGSLILSAVSGAEEGNYTCKAVNQEGTFEVYFGLDIAGEAIGSSAIISLTGSSIQMECQTGGRASENLVMWQHKERVLYESESVNFENGSLVISTIKMIDAGKYTCLGVSRRGGWKQTSFHLYVIPRKEPPFFTQEPEDIHVAKKDYLILHCKAASPGGETTAIRWSHEDKNITNVRGKRLVLHNNSLLIIKIRSREAGNYTCVASNQYGESRSSAVVTVSRLAVDEFIYVREGSTVELSCALSGEVEWVKDDRFTLPSYNRKVWLFHVNHTHQGDYTCSHGKQSINYYLVVRAPPRMTTPSKTVTISPGDTISLHCTATGRPAPKLSWHHDGHQLKTDNFRSILANGTLLLYEAESGRDGGVYTCKAQNIEGTDEIQSTLI